MNKMFRLLAAAAGAVTFTVSAADGSFDGMSKFVSKNANSLGYVDATAFRGNKIMKAGIDKVPFPGAAEMSDMAVKLMDVFDAALIYGSTDTEDVVLLVYGSKLTDVASLEAALKAALPVEAGTDMSVADVDGHKVLKLDPESGPGFVEVEPGLFLLDDLENISGDLAEDKGLGEQLAGRLSPYVSSKAFGIIAMPADDVPPVMEYTVVTIDPTGDDGVRFFNTFVLGEGMHVDTVSQVDSAMVDKLVVHVMEWYQKSLVKAINGDDAGQDQSEEVVEEEVEINEATE